MRPDEVGEAVTKALRLEVQKKATKIIAFSVVLSEGGIRQVKVTTEQTLK